MSNLQAKHSTRVGRTLFIWSRNEQNKQIFFPTANSKQGKFRRSRNKNDSDDSAFGTDLDE